MEYGSTFNINMKKDKDLFYVSGRVGIKNILNNVLKNNDKCLIPNYLCESIYNNFKNFEYYLINDDFEINIEYLEELINKNKFKLIYVINFFGFIDPNINKIIKMCKSKDIIIVEDYTHNIYSENLYGDICLCSYRKSLETPFGCIIKDRENILNIKQTSNINIFYIFLTLLKFFAMVLKNFRYIKFIWRPLLLFCENKLDFINYNHFDYINYFFYKYYYDINNKDVRKNNFSVIDNNIKLRTINNFRNTYFTYPIFVKNKNYRNLIVKKLSEKKIYCPYYWCLNFDKENKCNSNLVDTMLCLPIDQRYNEENMRFICKIVNYTLNNN